MNRDVCVFYSAENSTGKTTIMRAILYSLGFSIPSTEIVKFENYEFKIFVTIKEKSFDILRRENYIFINDIEFDLNIEQNSAISTIFGITNPELLDNLLGTFYFDQEKGWTLLNRGTIIGKNRFTIEAFFRGLKEDESDESYQMVAKINALRKKIAQYNLILSVAEYQDAVAQLLDESTDVNTYNKENIVSIAEKKMNLSKIESELSLLNGIIRENKNFANYIEKKKVYVNNPAGGDPILVTRKSLLGYNDVTEMNEIRRNMLIAQRSQLKKQIADIESQGEKQMTLDNLPTIDEELTRNLSKIEGISALSVKRVLDDFKRQKKLWEETLNNKTKTDNPWVLKAFESIISYSEDLNIPIDYKIDIFTHNLKGKSGAILHKMVFAYKLTYIKLLSEKIGYSLPIFCDSPSGREVETKSVEKMMKIFKRDFANHQLILSSIHKYDDILENAKIIQLDGTLFD